MQIMQTQRYNGRDLRAERVRAGLTQVELGELLGVSGRRIANVEGSIRVAPAFATRILGALAKVPVDVG